MSDEPPRPSEPIPHGNQNGLYEHYCEHPGCKAWGGNGFARNGNVKDTIWFCFEHRLK